MKPTNSLAVASLACGAISLLTTCICCYGLPFNVLGIVLGGIALSQINDNPEQEGKSFAIAGIATGLVSIIGVVVMMVFGVGILALSTLMSAAGR